MANGNKPMLPGMSWAAATEELKQLAVALRQEGSTVRGIAEVTGISEAVLYYQFRRLDKHTQLPQPLPVEVMPAPVTPDAPQQQQQPASFVQIGTVRIDGIVHDEAQLIELPSGMRGLVIKAETYRWLEALCIEHSDDEHLMTPEEWIEEMVITAVWREAHRVEGEARQLAEFRKWLAIGAGQIYTRGESN